MMSEIGSVSAEGVAIIVVSVGSLIVLSWVFHWYVESRYESVGDDEVGE